MKQVLATLSACFLFAAFAQQAQAAGAVSFLPENTLNQQDRFEFDSNMTKEQFNSIVDEVIAAYKPIAKFYGADLTSNNLWDDSTVNASAEETGKSWVVNMYGGLARRPEITQDGFHMVVCHELGHHFGGYAFYDGEWAASEGQADYFASGVCARKIWGNQTAVNAKAAATVDPVAKAKCDSVWSTTNDKNLCYRVSNAGLSLATLLAKLGSGATPKFDTPDKSIVDTTNTDHPEAQCRLDTYFAASLCTLSATAWDDHVIPGKNFADGQSSAGAEKAAGKYTCFESNGFKDGVRPHCWFKPLISTADGSDSLARRTRKVSFAH